MQKRPAVGAMTLAQIQVFAIKTGTLEKWLTSAAMLALILSKPTDTLKNTDRGCHGDGKAWGKVESTVWSREVSAEALIIHLPPSVFCVTLSYLPLCS